MKYEDLEIQEYEQTVPEHEWTDSTGEVHHIPETTYTFLEVEHEGQVYTVSFSPPPAEDRMYPELVKLRKDVQHAAFSRYLWEKGVIDEAL